MNDFEKFREKNGNTTEVGRNMPDATNPNEGMGGYLRTILATRERLKVAKAQQIIFRPPILTQNGKPAIFPNTINVIQGQAGVHKSRLAELMCSALLRKSNCQNNLAEFVAENERKYAVCVVDTERNLTEQLPYALQSIQTKAGFEVSEDPQGFDFISLLEIPRVERFSALKEYLTFVRNEFNDIHIFIVLDVITDCVQDFNQTPDSMEVIDLMNQIINKFNVTFLCLIHENPGFEKARGHLGTELKNKASTVIQVGFEKDSSSGDTDLIRVKYLKCRSTKRHEPFHLKYCEKFKGLVLANEFEVAEVNEKRKAKAMDSDVADVVEKYLADEPMKNCDLLELLTKDFDAGDRTMTERLKSIIKNETGFHNSKGEPCHLVKEKNGKEVVFKLRPIVQPLFKMEN